MKSYVFATSIALMDRKSAGLMLHVHVGTVGPDGGPKATMMRDAGPGLVWHVQHGDQVAVINLHDLLMEAARLVLDGGAP